MKKRARVPKSFLYKAIREKCVDCCGGQHKEVELCEAQNCPIWLLRFGARSLKLIPALKESLPEPKETPEWYKTASSS